MIAYLNSTPDLCSFNDSVRPDMDEVRYPDWVECELPSSPSASLQRRGWVATCPLYILPGGLMILLSPIEQYLPMEITTCCPAVDRLRSPLSTAPGH